MVALQDRKRQVARQSHHRNALQHERLVVAVQPGAAGEFIAESRIDLLDVGAYFLEKVCHVSASEAIGTLGVVGHVEVHHVGDFLDVARPHQLAHHVLGTEQALLLAHKHNKLNGTPGLNFQRFERAGYIQYAERADAVVDSTRGQIPRIEVATDDHALVALAFERGDDVARLDGLGEIAHIDVRFQRAFLAQPGA